MRYAGSIAEGFRVEVPLWDGKSKSFMSSNLLYPLAINVERYVNGWKPCTPVSVEKTEKGYKVRYFRYSAGGKSEIYLMFPVEQRMTHGAVDWLVRELMNNDISVQLPAGYEPIKAVQSQQGFPHATKNPTSSNRKIFEIHGVSAHINGLYEVDTSDTLKVSGVNIPRRARLLGGYDDSPAVWLEPKGGNDCWLIVIGVDQNREPYLVKTNLEKSLALRARDELLKRGVKTATRV